MNILVLDGGGSKGLASARFLQQFEQELGPVGERFDLICGVSTGAILGTLLANEVSATGVCQMYEDILPDVFPSPGWRFWRGITTPKYSSDPIEMHLQNIWRETQFGQLQTKTMVVGTKLSPMIQPKVWKSWDHKDSAVPVWQVVRASTAAPTYFRAHTIGQEVFVDGGLCTNEPSMCALAEAVRQTGTVAQHKILTVRPGLMTGYSAEEARQKTSPLSWLRDISGIMFQGTEKIAEYQCHSLIGFASHVVELGVTGPMDRVGQDQNRICLEAALAGWEKHRDGVKMRFGQP